MGWLKKVLLGGGLLTIVTIVSACAPPTNELLKETGAKSLDELAKVSDTVETGRQLLTLWQGVNTLKDITEGETAIALLNAYADIIRDAIRTGGDTQQTALVTTTAADFVKLMYETAGADATIVSLATLGTLYSSNAFWERTIKNIIANQVFYNKIIEAIEKEIENIRAEDQTTGMSSPFFPRLTVSAREPGPATSIEITVRDTAGLASISVQEASVNTIVFFDSLFPPRATEVILIAKKIIQDESAIVVLKVNNVLGNVTTHALSVAVLCDANGDGKVDRNDINLIFAARNTRVAADDPRDPERRRVITVNGARICALRCTLPLCAP